MRGLLSSIIYKWMLLSCTTMRTLFSTGSPYPCSTAPAYTPGTTTDDRTTLEISEFTTSLNIAIFDKMLDYSQRLDKINCRMAIWLDA
ncbi:Piso0_005103 [Millerozyma farinosa CBS 7064]|uniref:Piso0_005103 protein n=1 Tax=Pichia sorbitophila (strain ATCC MYA-4447 / BCRC 22081 / CBS 7064 / NBRC 10061 / NRRL Y-12695) TaxID=559304 RepID=G8Y486_PICSO|nr:Piso0_005103 [Millerozyma farinosa CBS 7064]